MQPGQVFGTGTVLQSQPVETVWQGGSTVLVYPCVVRVLAPACLQYAAVLLRSLSQSWDYLDCFTTSLARGGPRCVSPETIKYL